jgi:hypothetical protein
MLASNCIAKHRAKKKTCIYSTSAVLTNGGGQHDEFLGRVVRVAGDESDQRGGRLLTLILLLLLLGQEVAALDHVHQTPADQNSIKN